eukprot:TRINITY_DN71153_c0_g1_i2.p1 TRINITY_DN71153_c0_g1~~TRINITY_DN71153_c0_g1_i2.p1  ORF type:complete len:380 (+),score=56.32 TRINITY_DN71153_c0_g1_i2:85-1140(+)
MAGYLAVPAASHAAFVQPPCLRGGQRWHANSLRRPPKDLDWGAARQFRLQPGRRDLLWTLVRRAADPSVSPGQPVLAGFVCSVAAVFLRLCFAAEASGKLLTLSAASSRDVVLGRLSKLQLRLGRLRRGLRMQSGLLEADKLNLGFKPFLFLLTPVLMLWRPSILWASLLILLLVPDGSLGGKPRGSATFSCCLNAEDLQKCSLWRSALTVALRSIMENSVAGQLVLPREVSGQLSTATRFELEAVSIEDGRLVFDACAYLPENVQFKYRLRVGAIIAEIEGESCIFWDDPEIRVKTMWPLPDLWAPMVGVAGFRFPRQVKFSRIGFRDDGCIEVAGTLGQPDGALVVSSR